MKTQILIIFLLSLFLLNNADKARASSAGYYYKQLNIEHGLSQSRVQCMFYDHKGYMWIGTQYGLNCYDRDVLKNFFHEPGNENSLPSNEILFIVEDHQNNLWIGTKAGMCQYNRDDSDFSQIILDNQLLRVSSYLLTEDGILFGGIGEIYKYDYSTEKLYRLPVKREAVTYSSYINLQRLDEYTVIANTRWFGIYSYNLQTGELDKLSYINESNCSYLYIDSLGRIWVSGYGKGIYCYHDGRLLKHFTTENSPLTYNVILSIEEKDGYLWLATDGGGINLISLEDFSFRQMVQIQDDVSSFPTNAIYSLYKDRMNNMWVGSIRNGLIGIREVYAKSFGNVPFHNKYGLSNKTVNCFFEDSDGLIWIGTDGGGMNCYNPQSRTFRHYENIRLEKVTSILEYSNQELLIFLFSKGLYYFNKTTGALRPFIIIDEETNKKTCIDGYSVFISRIGENHIMISADHVFLYNITTGEFTVIASKDKEYVRNSPLIKQSANGKVYVVDLTNIYEYNTENGEFTGCYTGNEDINDMCIDTDNNFWIATHKGLFFYNPHTEERLQIKTDLFRGINSIVADKGGHVWIGTNSNLLFAYMPGTSQFVLMGESDGIMPNEYLFDAMLVSSGGDTYIGGTMGMTLINRHIPIQDHTETSIVLADILVNGAAVKESIDQPFPTVSAPWNFSSLQLKVMVKENDIFRQHAFRFNIIGDNTVKELKSFNHSLTLNYLPAGKYIISVSYITPGGEWSDPADIALIHITPPWWQTGWFTGICFMVLVCILLSVLTWVHKKRKKKQIQEFELMKEKIYQDKIRFLTNISHELRTPLTLIYSPLKRLLDTGITDAAVLKEQLPGIYKQSLQMKHIIDMVLDVRKLDEGKEVLHISRSHLNEWIRSIGTEFEDELSNRKMKLVYKLDDKIGEICFDKYKCKSVLSNLLMNALKFSEPEATITISSTVITNGYVRIEVKDEGIGLNTDDISNLFSPYYQGNHQKSGTGIGLSYAKALVDLHQGCIGAMNNPDKGATFYFELPLDNTRAEVQKNEKRPPLTTVITDLTELKNYSVLIAEDTSDLRNYLKNSLSEYFNRVYIAKDGAEGLVMVQQHFPDIIISDVMMPRMDGFEFCKCVKNNIQISHIPFILLTAYNNPTNLSTGYKLGADVFLAKPFDVEVLLSLINNQLKIRKSLKSRYNTNTLSEKEITFSNADETFLEKLNDILNKHISNPDLDVAYLAAEMGVSRSLLFNKVKILTDMGIVDYVNKLRIEKAVYLLQHSSLSITEISEKVGFSTSRYFSRVFKQLKGKTASEYRKKE